MIKSKNLSQGQSLLEIVVTMGLGLVVITGIAIVTVNGLKNSQLAKNQAVATKLAQQGLEKVRALRGQNCTVKDGSTIYFWFNDPPNLVYNKFATPVKFMMTSINTSPCLVNVGSPGTDPDMVAFPGFTREIELLDLPSDPTRLLRVTSIVTWSDYSGDHESRLATSFGAN